MGFEKRTEGRGDEVLDPERRIIDAHFHLFIRPGLRYLLEDYLEDACAGHRIVASVYVETQAFARTEGPEALRPLGEVEFANGVAAMSASGQFGDCRAAAAIVGHADLRLGERIGELLDLSLAAAPERFRGVRQIALDHPRDEAFRYIVQRPPRDLLHHPEFGAGLAALARRNLSFDAAVFDTQLGDLAAVADAYPGVRIVLNNLGVAMGAGLSAGDRLELFHVWRRALTDLALRPNVFCKVGGLGMPPWGFGLDQRPDVISYLELAETWKPYVETAIEAFGAARCMMKSNFPPDGRSCGFVPLWNALKHITRSCSDAEKDSLFHDTAAGVYRIALPSAGAALSSASSPAPPPPR